MRKYNRFTYMSLIAMTAASMLSPCVSYADVLMQNASTGQTIAIQGSDEEVEKQVEQYTGEGWTVLKNTADETTSSDESTEDDVEAEADACFYNGDTFDDKALSFIRENVTSGKHVIVLYLTGTPDHMMIPKDVFQSLKDNGVYLEIFYGASDDDTDDEHVDGGVFVLGGAADEDQVMPDTDVDIMPIVTTEKDENGENKTTIKFNDNASMNGMLEVFVALDDGTDGDTYTVTQNGKSTACEYGDGGVFISLDDLSEATLQKGVVGDDVEGQEYLTEDAHKKLDESKAEETTASTDEKTDASVKMPVIIGVVGVLCVLGIAIWQIVKHKK